MPSLINDTCPPHLCWDLWGSKVKNTLKIVFNHDFRQFPLLKLMDLQSWDKSLDFNIMVFRQIKFTFRSNK
jgi:hypothetical protein